MDPIRTPTLAELYAGQGHLDDAIAIYRGLLAAKSSSATPEERDHMVQRLSVLEAEARVAAMGDETRVHVEALRRLARQISARRKRAA